MQIGVDTTAFARSELSKKIEELTERIAAGHCKTFEEYRGLCGERIGLQRAYELLRPKPQTEGAKAA